MTTNGYSILFYKGAVGLKEQTVGKDNNSQNGRNQI